MVKNSLDKNQMFVFNHLIMAISNNLNYIDVSKISREFDLDYKNTKKLIASLVKLEITKFRKANDIHYVFVPIAQIVFEEGKAFFESPSKFLELVREKERYTTFDMRVQRKLSTKYAYMFYEIASLCFNQEKGVGYTERYTVENFKQLLGIEAEIYDQYREFKKFIINKNIKNLADNTEFLLTLREIKKGPKVIEIYFEIRKKENSTETNNVQKSEIQEINIDTIQYIPETKQQVKVKEGIIKDNTFNLIEKEEDQETIQRLLKLGITNNTVQELIKIHGLDFMIYLLQKTKIEKRSNVANKAGYLLNSIESWKESFIGEIELKNKQKEEEKLYLEKEAEIKRVKQEKKERFQEEQETLSREVLEQEPEIFCKELFMIMNRNIRFNIGFENHPDYLKDREDEKNIEENVRMAKEIRTRFQECSSFRDFKNLIKYDYSFMFKEVFTMQGQFIENDNFYYKSWVADKTRKGVELPFQI